MSVLETGLGPWAVTAATVAIIALSAFFVAVEFALMAAKQHRLEDRAHTPAGRAALKNSAELTVVLAGSQLGITVCTLALGAITKPAVHHALTPLIAATGLPVAVADVAAFVLALFVVTFLHLVVGEMAPKSWAIAHPEESSILLALPMRAFMLLARPILVVMNETANWLVRRAGVEPVSELGGGQDVESLRHLVEHSASVGALDAVYRTSLSRALELRERSVADVLPADQQVVAVPADGTVADVQAATLAHGHLRILVREGERTLGVVHVRDTLAEPDPGRPARELMREPLFLPADTGVAAALAQIRDTGNQLAVVTDATGERGVLTLSDVLPGLMPSAMVRESDAA